MSRRLTTIAVWFLSAAAMIAIAPAPASAALHECAGEAATITGTPGGDTLVGTPDRDVIVGLGGDDVIRGRGGEDLICGGWGNDVIEGGAKADVIYGEGGDDLIDGGAGPDVIEGGRGKDRIHGGTHHDVIRGGDAKDRLWGEDGPDKLFGDEGPDVAYGGAGNDRLVGGSRNDDLRGGGGDDRLEGKSGNDDLAGGPGKDSCDGGMGTDTTSTCETPGGGDAIVVSPQDDLATLVASHPDGTHFFLTAGVYRQVSLRPRSGNVFEGERGPNGQRLAILNGSKLLTSFSRSNGLWVATGQTQQAATHGHCFTGREGCPYSNDLFFDDVALEQVTSLAKVGPGKWFFDYGADRIYFADDPSGHKVEASVTESAISAGVSSVTIRGLVIEKYANSAQKGAVHLSAAIWTGGHAWSPDWLVEDNEFRLNHGGGLWLSDRMVVRNNHFHHNGEIGLGGAGDDIVVQGNEIAYNNTAGFSDKWEAGGAKFVKTRNLVVKNNDVHHNDGKGLWSDIDNIDVLIANNHVYDNAGQGIYQEIGYDAIIRDNLVERNGFGDPTMVAGAGIMVNSSRNVEVYGNTVVGNADGITGQMDNRGSGLHGPYVLENLYVHDNCIEMSTGSTGIVDYSNSGDLTFTSRNNRYNSNTYRLVGGGDFYIWAGDFINTAAWRATGNDANSRWQSGSCA